MVRKEVDPPRHYHAVGGQRVPEVIGHQPRLQRRTGTVALKAVGRDLENTPLTPQSARPPSASIGRRFRAPVAKIRAGVRGNAFLQIVSAEEEAAKEQKFQIASRLECALKRTLDSGDSLSCMRRAFQESLRGALGAASSGEPALREVTISLAGSLRLTRQLDDLGRRACHILADAQRLLTAFVDLDASTRQQPVRDAEELLKEAQFLEQHHAATLRSLAGRLRSLGVGASPKCALRHVMSKIQPSSDEVLRCRACGKSPPAALEASVASSWQPWWACSVCAEDSTTYHLCPRCGSNDLGESAVAQILDLAPALRWTGPVLEALSQAVAEQQLLAVAESRSRSRCGIQGLVHAEAARRASPRALKTAAVQDSSAGRSHSKGGAQAIVSEGALPIAALWKVPRLPTTTAPTTPTTTTTAPTTTPTTTITIARTTSIVSDGACPADHAQPTPVRRSSQLEPVVEAEEDVPEADMPHLLPEGRMVPATRPQPSKEDAMLSALIEECSNADLPLPFLSIPARNLQVARGRRSPEPSFALEEEVSEGLVRDTRLCGLQHQSLQHQSMASGHTPASSRPSTPPQGHQQIALTSTDTAEPQSTCSQMSSELRQSLVPMLQQEVQPPISKVKLFRKVFKHRPGEGVDSIVSQRMVPQRSPCGGCEIRVKQRAASARRADQALQAHLGAEALVAQVTLKPSLLSGVGLRRGAVAYGVAPLEYGREVRRLDLPIWRAAAAAWSARAEGALESKDVLTPGRPNAGESLAQTEQLEVGSGESGQQQPCTAELEPAQAAKCLGVPPKGQETLSQCLPAEDTQGLAGWNYPQTDRIPADDLIPHGSLPAKEERICLGTKGWLRSIKRREKDWITDPEEAELWAHR
ncbi:unnamed protein product [Polarella glacialis]|uniref:Uncharacterized protein n=1 Tax=Polarella glacialis TaxID=89957 RepID=A0A813DJL9_POLGL|nr:unnamed protein product [Polarella glacialis]